MSSGAQLGSVSLMAPKSYVLKAWSQLMVLLGGGGTFRRWGLVEEVDR
jgi:hypothetical protein